MCDGWLTGYDGMGGYVDGGTCDTTTTRVLAYQDE